MRPAHSASPPQKLLAGPSCFVRVHGCREMSEKERERLPWPSHSACHHSDSAYGGHLTEHYKNPGRSLTTDITPNSKMQLESQTPLLTPPVFDSDFPSELSDIFHTELFASLPSTSAPSSSRGTSPSAFISILPGPEPNVYIASNTLDPLDLVEEQNNAALRADPSLSLPLIPPPYNLFAGSLNGIHSTPSISAPRSLPDTRLVFTIDPQLVDSPGSVAFSDFSPEPFSNSEDDEAATHLVRSAVQLKNRKGTVVGGGVKKGSPPPSSRPAPTNKENRATFRASMLLPQPEDEEEDEVPDDWRPPPEVFQKMTSKEKRQLRNKISARNFRVRRKEYISTLEQNIAERDQVLTAICEELGSAKNENTALRQEIAALKRALLESRGPAHTVLLSPRVPLSPPIRALTPSAALSSSLASTSSHRASLLVTPNVRKDLAANSRFWGGLSSPLGGGFTSVHTVTVPELSLSVFADMDGKLDTALDDTKALMPCSASSLGPRNGAPHLRGNALGDANSSAVGNSDAPHIHLWKGTTALTLHAPEHQDKTHSETPVTVIKLPTEPRASKHLQPPSSTADGLWQATSSLLLSGKPSLLGHQQALENHQVDAEVFAAYAAVVGSYFLLSSLGGAFWDAFTGHEASDEPRSFHRIWTGENDVRWQGDCEHR
ncbi:unnamed protein product [Mycena citricolor]|uniref:BZIP domain-containing protein n=1 Tax=Mycena citricolor TaxID=2018698 RepID=A0AAD2H8L3_9AGAR|nr:unnamed protein product [Mycena citricolor]